MQKKNNIGIKNVTYLILRLVFVLHPCTNNNFNDKFQWEAAMCAPKYYPVGGARVDFGNAGNSSLTNFDNGWGHPYGAVSSAERYKKLPKEVSIRYASAVENLVYEGTVPLPYDKIKQLFKKHIKNKSKESGRIMAGMAPGGWIRIWIYFHTENGVSNDIEILKHQFKGKISSTMGEGFRTKKSDYWTKYKYYWDHFGIPLEAWAENEKEYDVYFNFYKPNPKNDIGYQYSTKDGTFSFGGDINRRKSKLPSDLVLGWWSKDKTVFYDTHILLPKRFTEIVKKKKSTPIEIRLEIEEDDQFGILFLVTNNQKEKILRFKNKKVKEVKGLGNSDFSESVEYFMK